MKFLLSSVILPLAFLSSSVSANPQGYYGNNGSYYGGQGALNTVAAIRKAGPYVDDAHVSLTGKLGRQVGKEHYEFSDGTGSITVEIDHEDLWGQQIGPNSRVMIYGEVDHEGYGVTIDVDMIRRAQ